MVKRALLARRPGLPARGRLRPGRGHDDHAHRQRPESAQRHDRLGRHGHVHECRRQAAFGGDPAPLEGEPGRSLPGGTFEQVFDGRRGNYLFRQKGGGGPNTTASIIVDVPGTVTLATSASVVDYGKSLRLSGKSSYPGTPVKIAQRAPGSGSMWLAVSTVTAAADGSYSLEVEPKLGARFRAQVAADQLLSDPVLISVRPVLTVRTTARRTKAGRQITVIGRVTPAKAATNMDLERYDPRRRRWFTQAKGRVRSSGGVTFKWTAKKGVSRLRVAVKPLSLGGGWAPAVSSFVTVTAD